jgi:hypothetical protein
MLKDLEVTPEDGLRDALSRLFVKDISQFLV